MPTRRHFIASTLALLGMRTAPAAALGIDATTLGLVPGSDADQGPALAAALDEATARGLALHLPAGRFRLSPVALPDGAVITGIGGRTELIAVGDAPEILTAEDCHSVHLSGLTFLGAGGQSDAPAGLVSLETCTFASLTDCTFRAAPARGVSLWRSAANITGCRFSGCFGAAIGAREALGGDISGNAISDCANLGIYVEETAATFESGSENGPVGLTIRGNRISRIASALGGDGQNGNGINLYNTEGAVVSGNVIADCAFSAIRLNTTRNVVVAANTCLRSGEVAVFCEFGFSGSVLSDNVIDGAAAGIALTNLDDGGRLATCTGNVVRAITPTSATNPDTSPYGIFAEADVALSANVVDSVPGPGLLLGWGPYGRNLSATGNVLTDCDIAIAVSVVEGVGTVLVRDNVISGARLALAGMEWDEVRLPDLAAAVAAGEVESVPGMVLEGNVIAAPG